MENLVPYLSLIRPELTLALGAMLLLMFGVARGERSAPVVSLLAVLTLALAGAFVAFGVGE